MGKLPYPGACGDRPMFLVPRVWPFVSWLRQPQEERYLLEVQGRDIPGQIMQGHPEAPKMHHRGPKSTGANPKLDRGFPGN